MKIRMMTNKEYIQSMNTEALADYLARTNSNGHSRKEMVDWLESICMEGRINVIAPGQKYTGDFEGEVDSWKEACRREENWLKEHGYFAQTNVDEQGKGTLK